jgi:PTS system nitrogen regulatory IIA component
VYLNVVQLAESFGVAESVVEGWVRNEGLPHVPERGRLLFDRRQVAAWAAQRGLASKVGFLAPEVPHARPGIRIESMLRAGGIWRDVTASQLLSILEGVVSRLPGASPAVRQLLTGRVRSPEGIHWAPIGGGLALPHLRTPVALGREAGILALLFLRDPLPADESAPDREPIRLLLFFVAPSPRAHLELLAQLSAALTEGEFHRRVLDAAPDAEIFAALSAADTAGSDRLEKRDEQA